MSIFQYKDYSEYRDMQIEANLRKINNGTNWVTYSEVLTVSGILQVLFDEPIKNGICHGVRNNWESELFAKILNCKVIGTDISPESFKHGAVVWDFHDTNEEWINMFDFLYTNSFDHCYDPPKASDTFMEQIREGGICIVQWTKYDMKEPNGISAYGGTIEDYRSFFDVYHTKIISLGDVISSMHEKTEVKLLLVFK